jgi:uncharacterized protein (DUF1800 family)
MKPARMVVFAAVLCGTCLAAGPAAIARQASAGPADSGTGVSDAAIVHALNRLGFGPRPGDVERVRRIGFRTYIERQLEPAAMSDEQIAARLASLETLAMTTRELASEYFQPGAEARRRAQRVGPTDPAPTTSPGGMPAARQTRTPEEMAALQKARSVLLNLQQQKILRAAYSDRQLEEVMVDFWFNHFNVFAGKGPTRIYMTEYERDTIRPRVFGRFRDLLGAVAQSPAMLFYLDNWQSAAPMEAARRPQRGNSSMARPNRRPSGINENYARELMELHTLGVDGGYTQKDVQEIARAFTGWTIVRPRQGGGFQFNPRMHDDGAKVVLGERIRGGGGRRDGEQVLDLLATHPSTARFISLKLARRFVSDDPPKALVARAAARFTETGGNIREVVRTIVTSPEFESPVVYRAKVKTPFEFVVSAVRAIGLDVPSAMPMIQATRELGMPLYMCQPPTGYSDRAASWVNTGALLGRMNVALSLTTGVRRAGPRRGPDRQPLDVPRQMGPVVTPDVFVREVLGGSLSASTAATVAKATQPAEALALLLGSPEFQKR